MTTKTNVTNVHTNTGRVRLFKFGFTILFTLLIAFGLLGGASKTATSSPGVDGNTKSDSTEPDPVLAQNQTATPTPEFLGRSDSSPPTPNTSSSAATSAASGSQVYIGFDVYPSGAPVRDGDPISNQYPPAIFSSDLYHYPIADSENWGTSLPNSLGRAPLSGFYNGTGYAPLVVQFTTPVNDLRFYIDAVDEFRQGIAQLDIFQNNQLTATRNIDGWGTVFRPIPIDVGAMGFNNVTKIEVKNINDYKGVGFDDFSFTLAPTPSPTPTPQPTPAAPANLTATVTDRQVRLNWTGSSGAAGYYAKRSTASGGPYTTLGAPQSPTYLDQTPAGDTNYFYVVSAFNSGGESPNSNPVPVSIPSACGNLPAVNQAPVRLHSPASGWEMTVEASPNDGMVLRDVSLNGRYMARSISVPYFTVATSKTAGAIRGELKPNSNDSVLRSRLINFEPHIVDVAFSGGGIFIQADYAIDRISGTSDSCLRVTQFYAFLGKELTRHFNGGRSCEPGGTIPCQTYFPFVSYKFESRNDEVLLSLNAIQRNQFWVNGLPSNGIGIFRDCDSPPNCVASLEGYVFRNKQNPVTTELKARVITRGGDAGQWDNIHQTYNTKVEEPGLAIRIPPVSGGCPECMHMHWRWGKPASLFQDYGNGSVAFYYPNTNQDMDVAIVKYKPLEQENAEPLDYASLANAEPVRLSGEFADVPDQVLVYFSSTGYRQEDSFFRHLYFFNPDFGSGTRSIQRNSSSNFESLATTNQDGPISVTFPNIYQDGTVSFEEFNPNVVAPLPQGYVAYNDIGYNITTEAEVSGPYIVTFGVPSAADQSVFNSLRILHAEPDPLDPEAGIWVDRTIVSPDTPSSDFSAKTINARVNNLAGFVIVRLVQPPTPNTGSADLSLTTTSTPDPVIAPNNITYTVTISNAGPDAATGVGLIDGLSPDVDFVSASSSQDTCKFVDGSVYCKLGSLNSGASTAVTIIVKPNEGGTRFPAEGREILNTAFVIANESDANKDNNSFVKSTNALPDPNAPPTIAITSPATGARYVGPANISIIANATDSDGSIAQVNFYDGETLIGSGVPASSNQYVLAWNNPSFGQHSIAAVATDNGGRKSASNPVNILVNGPATVNITSPSTGTVIAPHSNLVLSANASIASGVINKVDFFANSTLLGTVNGGGQASINWNDVPNGKYTITAVATDGSGVTTTSTPVSVVVSNSPTVSITSPQDGTSFGASPVLTISTSVQDDDSIIDKVTFFANGTPLGTGFRSGINQFTFTWRGVPDGIFSLTAVATDQHGLTTTSSGITIGVNTPTPRPGEFIWFDDALPSGAVTPTNDEGWHWVNLNPAPFSGTVAHQSRTLGQSEPPNSFHQHYFEGATSTLPVNAGDALFVDVFLDPDDMPREIMLQWKAADGWEHRAYWGENRIDLGISNTNSRRYWGFLPPPGQWVRLGIPASYVGLEGATLNGMAFSLDGGRATFDVAGKMTANAAPPPTSPPGDFVWMEDDLPPRAVISYIDDGWNWVTGTVYSGQRAHQTQSLNGRQLRQHAFTGAQTPMQVNLGDVLFTYVYLGDPDLSHQPNTPDQIMLQWYDGTSWSHRAFWGSNRIGQILSNMGRLDTEQHRYMGGLPAARGWYRLEVPASYVGLEGKSVSGMAFSAYRGGNNPLVTWDRSGKSPTLTTTPLPLSARTSIWRYYNGANGWAYQQGEQPPATYGEQKRDAFYALPNKAAGAVELHRFVKGNSQPFYYYYGTSTTKSGWTYENVAFYVFPPGAPAPPGTVPLHRYYDSQGRYFLTIDQNDLAFGMTNYDGIAGYVYSEPVPAPPTFDPDIYENICSKLTWRDNSGNETGFKIEHSENTTWVTDAVLERDVTGFKPICKTNVRHYRVRAYNSGGISLPSGACTGCATSGDQPPANTAPTVSIAAPANGDLVGHNFVITANAFDLDGNGTIVKVEFFANGSKIGEVPYAPHNFVWNNVPPGTYTLTAVATDSAGATSTSPAVNITVLGGGSPYNGVSATIPGIIEVENYNEGGPGIAYHDTTPGSHGQDYDQPNYPTPTFRQPTNVDMYKSVGYSNSYLLLGQAGDWTNYTVNVASTGSYTLQAQVTWGGSGSPGTFHVEVDGVDKTGPLQIPFNNWALTIITKTGLQLSAGVHVMRVVWDTNAPNGYSGDIDYLNFTFTGSSPYGGTPASIPGTIEAENFDNGGEGVAYHDTTAGSHGQDYTQPPSYPPPTFRQPTDVDIYRSAGYSNGYLLVGQAGDWNNYTVNVSTTGTYTLQAQVAWGGTSGSPGTFHVEVDGVDKTGPLEIPDTNWTFTIVTKTGVQLTAGIHVMRIVWDTNAPNGYSGDIDYVRFSLDSAAASDPAEIRAVTTAQLATPWMMRNSRRRLATQSNRLDWYSE